jgi:hypothetical protein
MTLYNIEEKRQADICINGKIDHFFKRFKLTKKMYRCGIRKNKGHSPRTLIATIFALPFVGKNFYRGIVANDELPFGKDAAYEILKGCKANWRRLLLLVAVQLYGFFHRLTGEYRETVLIIDDSTYDRSRSKSVELLSKVWDHSTGRFLKGFRMLTVCWSDGVSCLPMDFTLLSSTDASKRLCESRKMMDQRCCAWQRRKEAVTKTTAHLEIMVTRILSAGIGAKYVLMDSWFTMPATVTTLSKHIDVIGMVKKTPKVKYDCNGQPLDLKSIYKILKKRRGKAKILADIVVNLKGGTPAKLVFVRDKRKKDWLALLSTDIELSCEDVVRIYGKRWDIEVFFKMAKQHLKLAKEIQSRDFDALIGHTSIVFLRYMFLAYLSRAETDHRTFGDLFYACCQEQADITFAEALHRILLLVLQKVRQAGGYCEKMVSALFDAVMETALNCLGISKNRVMAIT